MGRKVRIRTLTLAAWSDLIERWNELPRDEMAALHAVCLADGHDWALAPIGALFCCRCVSYKDAPG